LPQVDFGTAVQLTVTLVLPVVGGERIRTSDLTSPNLRLDKNLSFVFSKIAATKEIKGLRFFLLRCQRLTAMCCEFCRQIGRKFFATGGKNPTLFRVLFDESIQGIDFRPRCNKVGFDPDTINPPKQLRVSRSSRRESSMSDLDIVRAWKDEEFRLSLTDDQRAMLPSHPAGPIDLDEELERESAARKPTRFCITLPVSNCCTP